MESSEPVNRNERNKVNFFVRLFRGDVSLPITYWVFGFLIGNVGIQLINTLIEFNIFEIVSTEKGAWIVTAFYWFVVGYSLFMLVAIWRSAGKYQGRFLWAGLARVAVVLGALAFAVNLFSAFQDNENTDFALKESFRALNKSLPSMLDSDTRLDYVSLQDRDIYYNYTLINMLVADMDVNRLISIMTPKLKTSGCVNEETRWALDEGRNLVYMYRDKNSKAVAKIVVEKSDCL